MLTTTIEGITFYTRDIEGPDWEDCGADGSGQLRTTDINGNEHTLVQHGNEIRILRKFRFGMGFPRSIKPWRYQFKINTDDMPICKPFCQWLRSKGIKFTKSLYYHPTKLYGFHVFYLPTHQRIPSFEANIHYCETLYQQYQNQLVPTD